MYYYQWDDDMGIYLILNPRNRFVKTAATEDEAAIVVATLNERQA